MAQPAHENAALSEEELYYTDMTVGEILRRAREHYGQSLMDIERALRIRASQIDAIECGDVERLPGRVYAIGFVRSYAEYLGLDGGKMVGLFKTQYGRKTSEPDLDFPVAASETKMPPLWMVGASLAAAIFIAILFFSFQKADHESVNRIPDVKEVMDLGNDQISGEAFGPFIPEGYDPKAKITSVEHSTQEEGIILTMTANSWVEIKDKTGKTLVSQVLKAGDQYLVPPRPDLTMSLGNAGGVKLELDGEALRPLGKPGTVLRNIPLDIEYLRKTFKAD